MTTKSQESEIRYAEDLLLSIHACGQFEGRYDSHLDASGHWPRELRLMMIDIGKHELALRLYLEYLRNEQNMELSVVLTYAELLLTDFENFVQIKLHEIQAQESPADAFETFDKEGITKEMEGASATRIFECFEEVIKEMKILSKMKKYITAESTASADLRNKRHTILGRILELESLLETLYESMAEKYLELPINFLQILQRAYMAWPFKLRFLESRCFSHLLTDFETRLAERIKASESHT